MSGFEIAGLVGTIQAVLHLAGRCLELTRRTGDANESIARAVGSVGRISFALESYREALNKLSFSENSNIADKRRESLGNLIESQEAALDTLRKRLQLSIDRTEAASKNILKRMTWVMRWQSDLDSQIQELEAWVGHFHLIYASLSALGEPENTKGSPEGYRRVLQVFSAAKQTLPNLVLRTMDADNIGIVDEKFGIGLAQYEENDFVVELIPYSDTLDNREVETLLRKILDVTKALCGLDPLRTHLLQCYGYFHDKPRSRFGLLFSIPPGYRPVCNPQGSVDLTLHSAWNSKPPEHSLDQRFRFAREIATGLLYVHAAGWVLKGLSPFSIILLERIPASEGASRKAGNLPHVFLVGIQGARTDDGDSELRVSPHWQLNIYRHPRRQTGQEIARFRMAYDVYSLGVVLLELGLWSLPHFRRFVSSKQEFGSLSPTNLAEKLASFIQGSTPENRLKGRGIHCSMGRRYAEVVEFCLSSGDDGRDQVETVERVWHVLDDIASSL